MKVMRNMSKAELKKFLDGEEIVGKDQRYNKSTVDFGVCFFPYDNEDCRIQVETWFWEIVALFEIDEELLTKGVGRYPDWSYLFDLSKHKMLPEYSIPAYSKKNAKFLGYHHKHCPAEILWEVI
jgi:hypothetical protein